MAALSVALRGGAGVAPDVRCVAAPGATSDPAGTLLRAQLPQPGAELSPQLMAPGGAGTGITPLVRALPGRNTLRADGDALSGRTAGGTTGSHRVENLA